MIQSNILNVYAIERMGMFDGPGVRYVLFLQGCPFKCSYCHNRDSWSSEPNIVMSSEEILKDYLKYSMFYGTGGITVSGGEPLLQLKALTHLFKLFKAHNIHTCLDTSGGLFSRQNAPKYDELLKYTDLVLLDIKHIDNDKHKKLVGTPNTHILDFARYLDENNVQTIIRHVLVPKLTSEVSDLNRLRAFFDTLSNVVAIQVLPYHTKGIRKWEKLGLSYPLEGVREPTRDEIKTAEKILIDEYNFAKFAKYKHN